MSCKMIEAAGFEFVFFRRVHEYWNFRNVLEEYRMAHKKGVSSSKRSRESQAKQHGLKKFGGAVVIPSTFLVANRKGKRKKVAIVGPHVKPTYLTKRLLVRLSTKAFREASQEAMRVMGHIVIEQDGWVVRKFEDGHVERIRELEKSNSPLIFD